MLNKQLELSSIEVREALKGLTEPVEYTYPETPPPNILAPTPEGEAIFRNARRFLLADMLKDKLSDDVFPGKRQEKKDLLGDVFGGGVQVMKARKALQKRWSNDELRLGIARAVEDKNLRRDLYSFLPASKGKLPERWPERKDVGDLEMGVKAVERWLKKFKKRA